MSDARHARLKAHFAHALDLPRESRTAYADEACAGDADLRRELEEMLAFEETDSTFLAVPQPPPAWVPAPQSGQMLGPFKILREIGRGGMGAVYEAEQERPRRRVALKVLHPGLATRELLLRFEREAEFLGRLEHPGIARLYEAGSVEAGDRPWFAMELVQGAPLTRWCEERALPLAGRLELVARVADAVHYAHQRGVVHRDLKPGNILVDANGQPRVLDFGVARTVDAELAGSLLHTRAGQVVGTLSYMSPEQASGDPDALDTRTDVYSLGAILYELVGGRPPLALQGVSLVAAVRRLQDQEPEPLDATARAPSDVAAIASKALAKDKERRYESAAALAADLRRFLRREAIEARPATRAYLVRRFAARNRGLVGGLALTGLALVLGLGTTLWQFVQKSRAEKDASKRRAEAELALSEAREVLDFLGDLFAAASPQGLGAEARIADVLVPAVGTAEERFSDHPRVALAVLDLSATQLLALGLVAPAEAAIDRAFALSQRLERDPRAELALGALRSKLWISQGRSAQALDLARELRRRAETELGAGHATSLELAEIESNAHATGGDLTAAIASSEELVARLARVAGADDRSTLRAQSELAERYSSAGDMARSVALLGEVLPRQREHLGAAHVDTLSSELRLAGQLERAGDFAQALVRFEELVPRLAATYGERHPTLAMARLDHARVLSRLKRAPEAELVVGVAEAALVAQLGAEHNLVQEARLQRADVLRRLARHHDAQALAKDVVRSRQRTRAPDDLELGSAWMKLGLCQQDARALDAAACSYEEALNVFRAAAGDRPNDYVGQALYNLGVTTRDAGDPLTAIGYLNEAVEVDGQVWGDDHRIVCTDRYNLGLAQLAAARPEAARDTLRRVVEHGSAIYGTDAVQVHGYRQALGRALAANGELDEAEPLLVIAIDGLERLDPGDRRLKLANAALAEILDRSATPDKASLPRGRPGD